MGYIDFFSKTLIMGVLNVTPDSFYTSSRVIDKNRAVSRALQFVEEGADIIDIGGESSRPGSKSVPVEEEIKRVIPVVSELRKRSDVIISVDTCKKEVAEMALDEGADIINDITGLRYGDDIARVVAKRDAYIVIMHMRGQPANMMERANYTNVVEEVLDELKSSVEKALKNNVSRDKIIIDPGIGFAKRSFHNVIILNNLKRFKEAGFKLLIGLSRKSFLGVYTGLPPEERLVPTVAANAISIYNGADIIRVHDVREAFYTARIIDVMKSFN